MVKECSVWSLSFSRMKNNTDYAIPPCINGPAHVWCNSGFKNNISVVCRTNSGSSTSLFELHFLFLHYNLIILTFIKSPNCTFYLIIYHMSQLHYYLNTNTKLFLAMFAIEPLPEYNVLLHHHPD